MKTRLRGYKGVDPISKRKYSRAVSIRRYKRTGKFAFRQKGEGHRAGERWGNKKEIDPNSRVTRYSKNSPSFDEGVYQYKQGAKAKALLSKMK